MRCGVEPDIGDGGAPLRSISGTRPSVRASTPHFRTKLRYKAIPQSISKRCSFHFAEEEDGLIALANTMIWAPAKMFFTLQDPLRLMSQMSALHCVTSVAKVFFTRERNLRSSASSEDFTVRRSWLGLGLALYCFIYRRLLTRQFFWLSRHCSL